MKTILAKSNNSKYNQSKQSYVEHTQDVINLINIICKSERYSENDRRIMLIIAVAHDLGKINLYMQEKLEIANRIDESEDEKEIENTLVEINKIINLKIPPKIEKYKYCNKCSYYEFCYIKELD